MDVSEDLKQLSDNSKGGAVFDASQYAFFGNDVLEEVELGGLDDEEEDLPAVELDEEEFLFDQEELNTAASRPRGSGIIGDKGSRESSSVAEWAHGEQFPIWLDQQALEAESIHEGKHWSSQPLPNLNPNHLLRASSYPEPQQQQPQQHHQHFSSEPLLVPKSSYTSYSPPCGRSPQASPNLHSGQLNIPYMVGGSQMTSSLNLSTLSNSQPQMPGLHHKYGGNMAQLVPGLSVNNRGSD